MTEREIALAQELADARGELARLQRDYEALVDNAADVLARFDSDGRFVYINAAAERNTGIPPEAFLGKTFRELAGLPEENIVQWEGALASVFATGEVARIEYEFPVPGRGPGFFECILQPEMGSGGEVRTVVTITRDLTARRQAENALQRTTRWQAQVLEALPVGVWVVDADGTLRLSNAEGRRLWDGARWGSPPPVGGNLSWQEEGRRQLGPKAWGLARTVFGGEPLLNEEIVIHKGDGSEVAALCSTAPLYGEDGVLIGGVVVNRDITERRQAEQALRDSEARKTAILEASLDCIITIDEQELVVEWNPAAEITFGFSRAQAMGRRLSELIIPPPLCGAHERGIAHFLATGEGPVLNRRMEVPALHADGTEFLVELTAVPIRLGGRTLFTAHLRDLTERERAAAQQRTFLRDVLASVTEGRLILCFGPGELPTPLTPFSKPIALSMTTGLRGLRQAAQEACTASGLSPDRGFDLVIAVGEAGMNAVVHVGDGTGQVFASDEGVVQVWVTDQGSGIALADLPHATLQKGYTTAGTLGHGMKMMLASIDRVFLLTGSTGTTVVLEQGRVSPPHLFEGEWGDLDAI